MTHATKGMSDRDLDIKVAELVMGFDRLNARIDPMNRNGEPQYYMGYPHGHDFAPNYSTDIASAMLVVEKMFADGWAFTLGRQIEDDKPLGYYGYDAGFWGGNPRRGAYAEREDASPAKAICLAALAALSTVKEQAG